MTQTGLIDSILEDGLIDSILEDVGLLQSPDYVDSDIKVPPKIKHVPAAGPLCNDTDTPPMTAT